MKYYLILTLMIYVVNAKLDQISFPRAIDLLKDITEQLYYKCILVIDPFNYGGPINDFFHKVAKNTGHIKQVRRFLGQEFFAQNGDKLRDIDSCGKTLIVVPNADHLVHQLQKLPISSEIFRVTWLIFTHSNITALFEKINVRYDSQVLAVVNIENAEENMQLYEIYCVGSGFPLHVKLVGSWSPEERLQFHESPLFMGRNNMENVVLKIVTTDYWPMSQLKKVGNETILEGLFPALWAELEVVLNFSSTTVRLVDGHLPGVLGDDGLWTGQLEAIHKKQAHAVVSAMDMSSGRFELLRWLHPVVHSGFQIFFRAQNNGPNWNFMLRPFSLSVWLAILFWVLISSLVLFCCTRTASKSNIAGTERSSLLSSIFFMLQALSSQGCVIVPKAGSIRTIFVVSYLSSLVIIAAYSGGLISSLTKQTYKKPYDNVHELLRSGDTLLVGNNTSSFEYFASAEDVIMKEAYNKLIKPNLHKFNISDARSIEGTIHLICEKNGLAILGNFETVRAWFETYNKSCNYAEFSQLIAKTYQSFALHKNSPFTNVLDYSLLIMRERGIVKRAKDIYLRYTLKSNESPVISVSINDVSDLLLFYFCGLLISLVIYLFEVWCFKRQLSLN